MYGVIGVFSAEEADVFSNLLEGHLSDATP
jgi:hypothetical protein